MFPLNKIRARLNAAGERGYVLVVALLVLATMMSAVGAMSRAALDSSNQSSRQTSTAGASSAADAGVQVALLRLNTTGTTAAATGSMGRGATYSYSIASLTSSSTACAGLWVQNSSKTVNQDCITSTGSVGGISERLQMRVAAYAVTTSLFPVNGVLAINGFTAAGVVNGTFDLGSNSQITFNNSIALTGTIYYPAGKLSQQQNANQQCSGSCTAVPNSSPYTVPTVADSVYAAAATTNNDAAIVWPSPMTYNATTRVVAGNGANNANITIPGGTYYFCNLGFDGNATTLNTTGSGATPVKIYIDSPSRPGSTCSASTGGGGNLSGANGFSMTNSSGVASNLQLYFYGQPGCSTSCPNNFSPNSTSITADVFAPFSSATAGNALAFTGALVIGALTANNTMTFNFQGPAAGAGSGGTNPAFYPSAHTTCIPSTTAGGTAGPC